MKSFNYALVLLFLATVAARAQQQVLRHMDETEVGITAPALNELVSVTVGEEPTGKLRVGMGGSDSLPVIALLDLDDIPRIHAALEDVSAYKYAGGTASVVATVGVLPDRIKSASATSVDLYGVAFGNQTVAGFRGAAFGHQTVAGVGGAAFGQSTVAGSSGAAFGDLTVAGNYGFAAGNRAKGANGSFVFADWQFVDFVRTNVTDGFSVRAQGGAYFAVPTLVVTGEVSAATFVGDGSGLTNLPPAGFTNVFAGAGTTGAVTSAAANSNQFLRGDGDWADPPADASDWSLYAPLVDNLVWPVNMSIQGNYTGGVVVANGGFIGDGSAVSNANATALFGSGVIPTTYLPNSAVESGVLVYTNPATNLTLSGSTNNWQQRLALITNTVEIIMPAKSSTNEAAVISLAIDSPADNNMTIQTNAFGAGHVPSVPTNAPSLFLFFSPPGQSGWHARRQL